MRHLPPRNVIEENSPLIYVTRIIGLRPIVIRQTKLFGYLYILIFWILYCTMVYLTVDYAKELFAEWRVVSKSMTIKPIEFIMNILFCTLTAISSIFNSIKEENTNSVLNKFDEKLKLLNVKFNYKTFIKAEVVHVFGIGLFTILTCLIEYVSLQSASRTNLYVLMSITNQLPQLVNSFAIVPFVIMCMKVSKRNEVINYLIPTMSNQIRNVPASLSIDMNNVFRVKLLSEAYGLLAHAVATINDTYASLLLISFSFFISWIFIHLHLAYLEYMAGQQHVDVFVNVLWLLFFLWKCTYIIHACHSMNSQGKRASILLHECQTNSDHHLLRQEMELFARQVDNTIIRFTVYTLFAIDYVILLKVILAMAAYILFLSQFGVETVQ
ncbi:gustatory receptor for sugar taste 43a-like isoform X2 [Diachasmimorpha longicaudata]|uniref:gustatory receptor for sugar taste 43a-like isoform X2 n=1 Tax=Diachasmimorpha longicaudata TaxID=58733 RepID=UPI0030B89DD0